MTKHLIRAFDLEAAILENGGFTPEESYKVCPVKHSFADGCYIREWTSPPGMLIVSKVHKIEHPYFILRGEVSVATDKGVERLKAPHSGITPAGTKRVLFTHTEVQWVTVHVTKETDLKKIESEIIAPDVDELPIAPEELSKLVEAFQ